MKILWRSYVIQLLSQPHQVSLYKVSEIGLSQNKSALGDVLGIQVELEYCFILIKIMFILVRINSALRKIRDREIGSY